MGRPTQVMRSEKEEKRIEEGLCSWCGKPRPKGKRIYCSDECKTDYWVHHDWGCMRAKILNRDNFTCKKCGFQVKIEGFAYVVVNDPNGFAKNDRLNNSYGYCLIPLVVDHIKPVALHPELEYEENNLQTLCKWCNKGKTRHDIQKIRRVGKTKVPVYDKNGFEIGLHTFYNSLTFNQTQLPISINTYRKEG